MHPRLPCLLLCVSTITHIAAAYRPYRPHDSSDLAQPHRVPRSFKSDNERENSSSQTPSHVSVSIRAVSESTVSSSHPTQIPPCASDCSPVALSAYDSPSTRRATDDPNSSDVAVVTSKSQPVPRYANTTITPPVPSLAARQIHNADYGSSNAPSSSSDSNSTEQAHPSSSASHPSATDSADSNKRREEITEHVRTGPPAARAAALRRLDISDLTPGYNKNSTNSVNYTETNFSRRFPRASALRRTYLLDMLPGTDNDTTTSSSNSTETKPDNSSERRVPRAAVMRRINVPGLPEFKNSTTPPSTPKSDDSATRDNSTKSDNGFSNSSPNQPERRLAFRFRRGRQG
ncbi:hypothetical protein EV368DRAFT_65502 [Lentinula lateritia]|uniref:Uncharacterized protein n=1 Tax=Lentinula aff. lateritia TaxID=2804960 RepID=A0ACC1U3E5_9AGAR|nr:hypothetical protein F5876DRAFT_64840 [Lentinula aff. lateritia]KAJ3851757.1 hypothetical protein EV368DRAFT_65502 [Lentinula lateritia]